MVALCRANHPFAAKSLLERISQDGYVADIVICNELIESLCKYDYVAEALVLKVNMLHINIKPNLSTYRALIDCLCRMNRTSEGESLMREMVESGLSPDPVMCRALVNGYCLESNAAKAESLLEFFAKEFQVFDTESYNALAKVFSEEGDVAKLLDLQDRMQKVGFLPNSLTCKYVVHGLWKVQEMEKKTSFHLNEF